MDPFLLWRISRTISRMKKSAGNQIKVGVFVALSIALLIAGIYLVGQRRHMFSTTFRISGMFSDIDGLQVGSNVRFAGINIGIVEGITLVTDTTVQVDMEIEENTRKFIKQNAIAVISSDGLVGDKIVSVSAGTPGQPIVKDNDFISTQQNVRMDDILKDMKTATANTVLITDDLAYVLESVANGNGMVGKLFFDSTFAEIIEAAMVNLKQGAGGFKQNMDAASHSVLLKGYLKKKEKAKAKAAALLKEEEEAPKGRTKRNLIGKD